MCILVVSGVGGPGGRILYLAVCEVLVGVEGPAGPVEVGQVGWEVVVGCSSLTVGLGSVRFASLALLSLPHLLVGHL